MIVKLSEAEILSAERVALERSQLSIAAGRRDRHGANPNHEPLGIHKLGAIGELAAAIAYEIEWPRRVNEFSGGKPDLDPNFEVRTRSKSGWDLIFRPRDKDDRRYILVIGQLGNPRLDVVGDILGRDARRGQWLRTHGGRSPAYFVPAEYLSPPPGDAFARPR